MKAYASMAVAVLNGADPATVGTVPTGADFPAFAEVVRDYAETLGLPVPAEYTLDAVTPPDDDYYPGHTNYDEEYNNDRY